jgi:hypothetical protein
MLDAKVKDVHTIQVTEALSRYIKFFPKSKIVQHRLRCYYASLHNRMGHVDTNICQYLIAGCLHGGLL